MKSSDWIWLAAMLAALWGIYRFSTVIVRAVIAVNNWVKSIEANTQAHGVLKEWLENFTSETNTKFVEFDGRLETVEGMLLVRSEGKAV